MNSFIQSLLGSSDTTKRFAWTILDLAYLRISVSLDLASMSLHRFINCSNSWVAGAFAAASVILHEPADEGRLSRPIVPTFLSA